MKWFTLCAILIGFSIFLGMLANISQLRSKDTDRDAQEAACRAKGGALVQGAQNGHYRCVRLEALL
jgi:hypothetical protein